MALKRKSRRRKKIKFKRIEFKMTTLQYDRLKRYCSKHKLTPVRLVRKALNVYIDRFGPELDHIRIPVGKNQLSIFDIVDKLALESDLVESPQMKAD